MEKYTHQKQVGTSIIKKDDTHLHIQQPDPITGTKQWIIFENKEGKELIEYLNKIYAV